MGKGKKPRVWLSVRFGIDWSAPFRLPPHWIVLAIGLVLYLLGHGPAGLPPHWPAQG